MESEDRGEESVEIEIDREGEIGKRERQKEMERKKGTERENGSGNAGNMEEHFHKM